MKSIENMLNAFDPVSLEEANQKTELMMRIDRKYWFAFSMLEKVLKELQPICDVLEVKGKRVINYQTTYFDTPGNDMYLHHHNGQLERYKVRRRKYETSGTGFFEIKRKNNKRITRKMRIASDFGDNHIIPDENEFLAANSPYKHSDLHPALSINFYRITLISKSRKDRCTIDLQTQFMNETNLYQLNDLVIFELKRSSQLNSSRIVPVLRKLGIRHRGLSKYCTGLGLLDDSMKKNAFKPRLRYLEKITENQNLKNV